MRFWEFWFKIPICRRPFFHEIWFKIPICRRPFFSWDFGNFGSKSSYVGGLFFSWGPINKYGILFNRKNCTHLYTNLLQKVIIFVGNIYFRIQFKVKVIHARVNGLLFLTFFQIWVVITLAWIWNKDTCFNWDWDFRKSGRDHSHVNFCKTKGRSLWRELPLYLLFTQKLFLICKPIREISSYMKKLPFV